MNEIEKMRNGELADMSAPEVQESFIHAKKLLARLRAMSIIVNSRTDWCRKRGDKGYRSRFGCRRKSG